MGKRGSKRALACLLGLGAGAALAGPPASQADRARAEAYHEFRRLFAAGDYAAALPRAEEVLRLTRSTTSGADQLPQALNNLGVVQLRAGDTQAAERSFRAALAQLDATLGVSSPRKLSALSGLGAAQAAQGRHADAVVTLQQALALSRRSAGLFNPAQLDLLEAQAASLEVLGDVAGVDRERRYAAQVAQRAYGPDDPRVLPWLEALAGWYERTERFAEAADVHRRRVEIAAAEDGGRNAATVRGLLDLGRAHRLHFLADPEAARAGSGGVADTRTTDPHTWGTEAGTDAPAMPRHTRLLRPDAEGLRSLERAVSLLESVGSPPADLLARAWLEIGDWHLTEGNRNRALEAYARAWQQYERDPAAASANPLGAPRPVVLRSPAARSRIPVPGTGTVPRQGDFRLVVEADGTVSAVEQVGGDLPDARGDQLRRALRRALFSPRFEAGQPVPTLGHALSESWWLPPQDGPPRVAGTGAAGGS